MKCKFCKEKEAFKYSTHSSGEFCSRQCACAFSTFAKRSEINKKIASKLRINPEFGNCLECGNKFKKRKLSNVFCSRSCSSKFIANDPITKKNTSSHFSKISKKRHSEGDPSIGWKSRFKLEPSYPERLTIDFLNSINATFEREVKVGKYFIDFAFPNKIALEIDGRRHNDSDIIEKDKRKDIFLMEHGWKVVRIKWINDRKHFDRLKSFYSSMVEH